MRLDQPWTGLAKRGIPRLCGLVRIDRTLGNHIAGGVDHELT